MSTHAHHQIFHPFFLSKDLQRSASLQASATSLGAGICDKFLMLKAKCSFWIGKWRASSHTVYKTKTQIFSRCGEFVEGCFNICVLCPHIRWGSIGECWMNVNFSREQPEVLPPCGHASRQDFTCLVCCTNLLLYYCAYDVLQQIVYIFYLRYLDNCDI